MHGAYAPEQYVENTAGSPAVIPIVILEGAGVRVHRSTEREVMLKAESLLSSPTPATHQISHQPIKLENISTIHKQWSLLTHQQLKFAFLISYRIFRLSYNSNFAVFAGNYKCVVLRKGI